MTHQQSAARLEFLTNSARILSTDSPTTSAHLLAVHNDLLFSQCKALTSNQEREFCPACGSLRVPGWTSSVTTTPKQLKSKRRRSSKPHTDGQTSTSSHTGVAYKCLRCNRSVIQSFRKSRGSIQKEPRRPPPSSSISQPLQSSATVTAAAHGVSADARSEKKTTENASSKKRAKARKNQGLLATLAAEKRQPQPQKPSSSLDLLDFLQQ